MSEIYNTQDIWLGSVLLCESNAKLEDVQISRNGRETVSFCFRGENLNALAKSYCEEEAVANVAELRRQMNFLRDIIFASKKKT